MCFEDVCIDDVVYKLRDFLFISRILQKIVSETYFKHRIREEEENNLPQMKKLFFLYVWLNLTRIAKLRK